MDRVFISYSRRDYLDNDNKVIPGNIVSRIKEALTQEGISYWFDEEGITHGDEFASIIVKRIRDCQVFVFISSANSNKSVWTSREIATAFRFEKKIIPFRYDRTPYNDEVMLYLSTLDYVEYNKNPDTAVNRLIKAIQMHLNEIERETARKQKELEEKRRREGEEKRKAERLESLDNQIAQLNQKHNELEVKREAARNSIAQIDSELLGIDASLEELRYERGKLLGEPVEKRNPAKEETENRPNPQPPKRHNAEFLKKWNRWSLRRRDRKTNDKFFGKADGNVFTRGWEDIKCQWKSNPMLANIFAVLAICALAYLLYSLSGIALKTFENALRTANAKRIFSYEYAAIVGTVLVGMWGIVKFLRKDVVGYFYLIIPPAVLSFAYLFGKTSKLLGPYYKMLFLICGVIGFLSVVLLFLRKDNNPFYSMFHLKLGRTFKDWGYLAVWGSALILFSLFLFELWRFGLFGLLL